MLWIWLSLLIFVPNQLKLYNMETLKNLFINAKDNNGFDHTEWIETNRGDLRLFASTDWLSNKVGEIQVETEQGEVFSLNELNEDEIVLFTKLLTQLSMRDLLEKQIFEDANNGDTTVLADLLERLSDKEIFNALSDKNQIKFK